MKNKPWKHLPKGFLLIRKNGIGVTKDNKYQFFEGLSAKEVNKLMK